LIKVFKAVSIDFNEITLLLRTAMGKLDNHRTEIKPSELIHAQELDKNPEEYKKENDPMRKRGLALGLKAHDVIRVYESDNEQGWSLDSAEISVKWYKTRLWTVVKELLSRIGMPVDELALEFGITIKKSRKSKRKKRQSGHIDAEPSRGVADNDDIMVSSANLQVISKGGESPL
jgi:hypothetical protein